MGILAAAAASAGVYLLLVPGPGGRHRDAEGDGAEHGAPGPGSVRRMRRWRIRAQGLLDRAGLDQIAPLQFVAASIASGLTLATLTGLVFGAGLAPVAVGFVGAAIPTALWRSRRAARRRAAHEAWPRLIEELRISVGAAGRSVPQALVDVGLNGPAELREAFRAAQREWALSTDFDRMITVLKRHLADPTADVVCETLLTASEVGGDLDARLAAMAEDRRRDLTGRREAEAKQAGARLARAFVIVVPAGMALAGLSVGDGRAAYSTPQGQALVMAGIAMVVLCWIWAARIMHLPEPKRVFDR